MIVSILCSRYHRSRSWWVTPTRVVTLLIERDAAACRSAILLGSLEASNLSHCSLLWVNVAHWAVCWDHLRDSVQRIRLERDRRFQFISFYWCHRCDWLRWDVDSSAHFRFEFLSFLSGIVNQMSVIGHRNTGPGWICTRIHLWNESSFDAGPRSRSTCIYGPHCKSVEFCGRLKCIFVARFLKCLPHVHPTHFAAVSRPSCLSSIRQLERAM